MYQVLHVQHGGSTLASFGFVQHEHRCSTSGGKRIPLNHTCCQGINLKKCVPAHERLRETMHIVRVRVTISDARMLVGTFMAWRSAMELKDLLAPGPFPALS